MASPQGCFLVETVVPDDCQQKPCPEDLRQQHPRAPAAMPIVASIDALLARLGDICTQDLDEQTARGCKQQLRANRYFGAMYDVLCESKAKMVLPNGERREEERFEEAQIQRLDNMLVAEGILSGGDQQRTPTPPTAPVSQNAAATDDDEQSANSIDQNDEEYRVRLQQIRQQFHEEAGNFQNQCSQFGEHVAVLLREQQLIRPLNSADARQTLAAVERRFRSCSTFHKQLTCERVMLLRSKFLDARRKRRNFSKQATQVLNEYFHSHLTHPYPSEEVKEELAIKCNITVSQVSNWFGNKRIRYKKTMSKQDDEHHQHLVNGLPYDPYLPMPPTDDTVTHQHPMYPNGMLPPAGGNSGFNNSPQFDYDAAATANLLHQPAYEQLHASYETSLAAANLSYHQLH